MEKSNHMMQILLKETVLKLLKNLTPKLYKFRFDENNTVVSVAKNYLEALKLNPNGALLDFIKKVNKDDSDYYESSQSWESAHEDSSPED